ncbi:hypothetical protein GCM10010433_73280 [Streptomyces pulveraceus]
MGDVGLNRTEKGVLGGAFEEFDIDRHLATDQGGQEPVHPVDHAHVAAADEDGGQGSVDLGQPGDVFLVRPFRAGGLTGQKRRDRDRGDSRLAVLGGRG